MLDIQYIREHADQLKTAAANKQLNPEVIDTVLTIDEQRRDLIKTVEDSVAKATNCNAASKAVAPPRKKSPKAKS